MHRAPRDDSPLAEREEYTNTERAAGRGMARIAGREPPGTAQQPGREL